MSLMLVMVKVAVRVPFRFRMSVRLPNVVWKLLMVVGNVLLMSGAFTVSVTGLPNGAPAKRGWICTWATPSLGIGFWARIVRPAVGSSLGAIVMMVSGPVAGVVFSKCVICNLICLGDGPGVPNCAMYAGARSMTPAIAGCVKKTLRSLLRGFRDAGVGPVADQFLANCPAGPGAAINAVSVNGDRVYVTAITIGGPGGRFVVRDVGGVSPAISADIEALAISNSPSPPNFENVSHTACWPAVSTYAQRCAEPPSTLRRLCCRSVLDVIGCTMFLANVRPRAL